MSGHGRQTFPDGETYDGEFLNGHRNGLGVYKWSNGAQYVGDFVNNSRLEQGTPSEGEGLIDTVDLLNKIGCFVKKSNI
jgi:hypothetical protein